MTLEDDLEELEKAIKELETNCPWLNESRITGGYTEYGRRGALCKRPQKVRAGRAAANAYRAVRDLEYEHLEECKERIKRRLAERGEVAEEGSRFLLRDLFDKCEKIHGCISCSCGPAVSAYYNLRKLADILSAAPT